MNYSKIVEINLSNDTILTDFLLQDSIINSSELFHLEKIFMIL